VPFAHRAAPSSTLSAGRVPAYDLARAFAIIFVFLGHSVVNHTSSRLASDALSSVSPWLTMSLLGCISALLLANRDEEAGEFLIKRGLRIYPSLFISLGIVIVVQLIMGTAVLDADTAVQFMGLSGVYSLISAPNHSSIGSGLWFVTVILVMYALLPLLRRLFRHKYGLIHLLVIVALGLAAHTWLFADGMWNVVIAFCIGAYLAVSGRIAGLSRCPPQWAALGAAALLIIYALASLHLIPTFIRGLFLPLYPVAFLPLFFWAASWLPRWVMKAAAYFAVVSYEFYILHFYFINAGFSDLFGTSRGLAMRLVVGFAISLALATVVYLASRRIRWRAESYLLGTRTTTGEEALKGTGPAEAPEAQPVVATVALAASPRLRRFLPRVLLSGSAREV
jgi:peptidoglycan/LPS O-acetylase OafA/YrhL